MHRYRSRALVALQDFDALAADIEWFNTHGHPLDGLGLSAQSFAERGQPSPARRAIKQGLSEGGKTNSGFLRRVVRVYQSLGDLAGARNTLNLLWEATKTNPSELHRTLLLRASVERRMGNSIKALTALERAQLARPTVGTAVQVIKLTRKINGRQAARRRLQQAMLQWPNSAALKALKDELQNTPRRDNGSVKAPKD